MQLNIYLLYNSYLEAFKLMILRVICSFMGIYKLLLSSSLNRIKKQNILKHFLLTFEIHKFIKTVEKPNALIEFIRFQDL